MAWTRRRHEGRDLDVGPVRVRSQQHRRIIGAAAAIGALAGRPHHPTDGIGFNLLCFSCQAYHYRCSRQTETTAPVVGSPLPSVKQQREGTQRYRSDGNSNSSNISMDTGGPSAWATGTNFGLRSDTKSTAAGPTHGFVFIFRVFVWFFATCFSQYDSYASGQLALSTERRYQQQHFFS